MDQVIETQNELWKIWLKKFEDKPEEATSVDDEILLIEGDDTKQNDDEEEQDDTEIIFERYLNNLKHSGFIRTTPAEQQEPPTETYLSDFQHAIYIHIIFSRLHAS